MLQSSCRACRHASYLRSEIQLKRNRSHVSESHYFDPSAWRLVPGHTVHVSSTTRTTSCIRDGWYGANGHRHLAHAASDRADEAAERGVPAARRADRLDATRDEGARGRRAVHGDQRRSCATAAFGTDTWGYEILEELEPRPEDWYVEKTRLSAFFQTNLELVLRSARRRDGPDHRRADEPVCRRDVQGRALPRLQADRGRRSASARLSRTCTSRRSR